MAPGPGRQARWGRYRRRADPLARSARSMFRLSGVPASIDTLPASCLARAGQGFVVLSPHGIACARCGLRALWGAHHPVPLRPRFSTNRCAVTAGTPADAGIRSMRHDWRAAATASESRIVLIIAAGFPASSQPLMAQMFPTPSDVPEANGAPLPADELEVSDLVSRDKHLPALLHGQREDTAAREGVR